MDPGGNRIGIVGVEPVDNEFTKATVCRQKGSPEFDT